MSLLAAALLAALSPAPARAAPREIEPALARAVDLFYDLDFEGADAACRALEERFPGHPAGPFYRAVAGYQRWAAEGMSSAALLSEVEAGLLSAQAAAQRLAALDPAQGHYYAGAAKGFRARSLASRGRYLAALPLAASAVRDLRRALELDPSLDDARLGLGMYHYFAARMPLGARPFALLLMGEGPDRQAGLRELEAVAASAAAARMEARSVLAMIRSRDGEADWDGAESLLAELSERYPRNPLYRLRRAYVAQRRGRWEEAARLADPEGAWLAALRPSLRGHAAAAARYRAAESLLRLGRLEEAEKALAALDLDPPAGEAAQWAKLRRGNLLDAQGRRAEADAAYASVSAPRPRMLARKFRAERFPAGPDEVMPFFSGY